MFKWRIVKRDERGSLVFYWQCAGDDAWTYNPFDAIEFDSFKTAKKVYNRVCNYIDHIMHDTEIEIIFNS